MSAAATAAGYLYASGRLRGREKTEKPEAPREAAPSPRIQKPIRVAAMPAADDQRPKKTPTIQYRTRRWKPEQNGE
jgi:hypothetical protein